MVKAVVWGGMLIVALGGLVMGTQAITGDSGKLVGYAIGETDANNQCELQVVVTLMMAATDGPTQTVSSTSTRPDWVHWAKHHFLVVNDATGQAVDFKKGGFKSKDISENQANAAELIVLAKLDAGQSYTFHYVPVAGEPQKYVKKLTGAAKPFRRENFDPDY